jgi:hypothetical protein
MPTFLSDPSPTFYLILIAFFVIALVIAGKNQDRRSFRRLGIATVALAAVFLIDWLVESPREQAVRKIQEISAAINDRSSEKMLQNVSDSFDFKGKKKADLAQVVHLAERHGVRTATWELSRDRVAAGPGDIEIAFEGKAEGPRGEPFMKHFRARFVKDPDGQYRLQTFKVYDYVQKEQESDIPGF